MVFTLYLIVGLLTTYLSIITPETHLKLAYIGIISYSSYQIGLIVSKSFFEAQAEAVYQQMIMHAQQQQSQQKVDED